MESNTDRMYWTVGVIVLGAIVIGGASLLFPGLIHSVGDKIAATLNPPVQVV